MERSLLLLEFMVGACFLALVTVIALQIFGRTSLSGLFLPVDAGLPKSLSGFGRPPGLPKCGGWTGPGGLSWSAG